MDIRALGRTGMKVSVLCLGCMNFGGKTTPDDSYAIIDRALDADAGGTFSVAVAMGIERLVSP